MAANFFIPTLTFKFPIAVQSWMVLSRRTLALLAAFLACASQPVRAECPITFEPRADYQVGSTPYSVTIADFNADGILDLAVPNVFSDTVSIFLGNNDGSFAPKVDYSPGSGSSSAAVGDFNGDGHLDLAVANAFSNDVGILFGDGTGGFGAAVSQATGTYPTKVAAADFNGDGILDLVTANAGANTISVLLGDGLGGFSAPNDFAAGDGSAGLVAADFNKDGILDLAVSNIASPSGADVTGTLSVLLGNGDGTFQPKVDWAVGFRPDDPIAADLNGDGNLDLAVGNTWSDTISILFGNGDGTFQDQVVYSAAAYPTSIALTLGDFNCDGKVDLAVANYYADSFSIFPGNGDGTFQERVDFPVRPIQFWAKESGK